MGGGGVNREEAMPATYILPVQRAIRDFASEYTFSGVWTCW